MFVVDGARIATHFGRPGTPNDQALDREPVRAPQDRTPAPGKIEDPGELERELDRLQPFPRWLVVRPRTGLRSAVATVLTCGFASVGVAGWCLGKRDTSAVADRVVADVRRVLVPLPSGHSPVNKPAGGGHQVLRRPAWV